MLPGLPLGSLRQPPHAVSQRFQQRPLKVATPGAHILGKSWITRAGHMPTDQRCFLATTLDRPDAHPDRHSSQRKHRHSGIKRTETACLPLLRRMLCPPAHRAAATTCSQRPVYVFFIRLRPERMPGIKRGRAPEHRHASGLQGEAVPALLRRPGEREPGRCLIPWYQPRNCLVAVYIS
jgi:hypothetical protein